MSFQPHGGDILVAGTETHSISACNGDIMVIGSKEGKPKYCRYAAENSIALLSTKISPLHGQNK